MKYNEKDPYTELLYLPKKITNEIKPKGISPSDELTNTIREYMYHKVIAQLCRNPEAAKEAGIDPETLSFYIKMSLETNGMGEKADVAIIGKINTEINDAFAPLLNKVRVKGHS